jgi:hypothetical protein
MDYIRLGNTGLKVSRLCLGAMTYGTPEWRPWVLDEAASRPFIARAREHGINFFDTADMYSRGVSEQVLGRALKDEPRDQLVIATKAFYPLTDGPNTAGLSRKHLLDAIEHRSCGSAPITSTSTRSIASIPARRSRKRSRRSTTSSSRGRRATSARRACSRRSS